MNSKKLLNRMSKFKTWSIALVLILLISLIFSSVVLAEEAPDDPGTVDISKAGPQVGEPQYGGNLTLARPTSLQHFDDAAFNVLQAPTLALTNEDLLMGDWTKGPAGTAETTWIYTMMPSPYTLEGSLAKNWKITEPDTIVFHIRQGVHFHDKPPANGREMTADDVVFSLNRLWDTPTSQHYRVLPRETHIQSITTKGKWQVVLKCYPGKLAAVYEWASSASKIVPPEVIDEYGDMEDWENSSGTGPFMLTDYVEGSHVTFTRNPCYWMRDPFNKENTLPYLNTVKWYIIPDKSTRIAALRTGKIDTLNNLEWEDAESLMITNPELEWIEYPRPLNPALFMRVDTGKLPFDDIRVRRALALAVDNQAIKDSFYGGYAEVLSWPIMPTPEFIDMYTPLDALPESTSELYGYDRLKADQLLSEAGYPDGFRVEIVCNATHVDLLSIIKDYWADADIGVELVLDVKEYGVWRAAGYNKTYQHMYMDNVYAARPFEFANLRTGSLLNFSLVDDPAIDAAYEAVAAAYFNEPERRQLMKDIVPYILDQSYILVPPSPHLFTTWQPRVKGYHGEYSVGYLGAVGGFPKYIWVD